MHMPPIQPPSALQCAHTPNPATIGFVLRVYPQSSRSRLCHHIMPQSSRFASSYSLNPANSLWHRASIQPASALYLPHLLDLAMACRYNAIMEDDREVMIA